MKTLIVINKQKKNDFFPFTFLLIAGPGSSLAPANINPPRLPSFSQIKANEGNSSTATQANQLGHQPRPCMVREQDQYMPIANVIRIMRRILPAHAKISDDAKETIQECVSEYISFITGEANERCQREQRKTITAEDVLWAMGKLGFDNYIEPLTLFLNRYRETENDRSSIRENILKRSSAGVVEYGMPAFVPSFPMGPPPPAFGGSLIGGYYRNVSDSAAGLGGGSSDSNPNPNPLANFDPFAQFK